MPSNMLSDVAKMHIIRAGGWAGAEHPVPLERSWITLDGATQQSMVPKVNLKPGESSQPVSQHGFVHGAVAHGNLHIHLDMWTCLGMLV